MSGRPFSHPYSSQSDSHPPRIFGGDPIPIVYSLETYAWTIHCRHVSPCLLSSLALLFAFLVITFVFAV